MLAVVLLSGASDSLAKQRGEVTVVSLGKSPYVVVYSSAATAVEKNAARELTEHLTLASGAILPVRGESEKSDAPAIYIGRTAFAQSHGISFADFGPEEWLIKTVGKDIVIGGGRPRGTLYGVWEFLERQIGIMWLDESYTFLPKMDRLSLPEDFELRGKPAFAVRGIYAYFKDESEKRVRFMARNRQNHFHDETNPAGAAWGLLPVIGSPRACHTFFDYTRDWPAKYEECFSMSSDGKRLRAISAVGPGQVCFSNPQARRLFASRLREYIQADRRASPVNYPVIYVIEANDNEDKCVCPACLARERKYGAYSGALLEFINAIADDICGDYPDVKVQTAAYLFSEKPPRGIVPRPNVLVKLAQIRSDTMRPLTHPNNHTALSQLRDWGTLGTVGIWDYWIMYGTGNEATVNLAAISSNLRLYQKNRVESVFAECESPHTCNFYSLRLWMGYQLMQNPVRDANLLVDKFLGAYYGAAAPFMQRLLDYIGTRMEEIKEHIGDVPVSKRTYLDNDFFKTAEGLLASAEKAAGGDAGILYRIAKERVPLDIARLNRGASLSKDLTPSRQEVIRRLHENAPDVVKDFYPRAKHAELIQEINGYIDGASVSVPLPAEFKDRDVADIIWTSFKPMTYFGAHMVDDPDAVQGRAMKLGKPQNVSKSDSDGFHASDLEMGLYSASSKRAIAIKKIPKAKLPQDEKFHFYSLGRDVLEPKCYVWAHKSCVIQQTLWECYQSNGISNECEIYLSLKVQGPSYVNGSKRDDAVLMDRVLLVRPARNKQ